MIWLFLTMVLGLYYYIIDMTSITKILMISPYSL